MGPWGPGPMGPGPVFARVFGKPERLFGLSERLFVFGERCSLPALSSRRGSPFTDSHGTCQVPVARCPLRRRPIDDLLHAVEAREEHELMMLASRR